MSTPPIPARCAHRPLTRGGLVVPFVSVVAARPGEPHIADHLLGEIHESRAVDCIREGRCQVCGDDLDRPFVILTTDESLDECWSSEPPLHPECARYSRQACPMLAGKMATYRRRDRAEGRPCTKPGCDCAGWVNAMPHSPSKAGQPAERWFAVWLDDYGIAVEADGKTINGVTWRGITPRRVKPLG